MLTQIVPRIWAGDASDANTEENQNRFHSVEATLDVYRCAREILWWAWGHNEDVLVWSFNSHRVESVLAYFMVECMAFTDRSAREFIRAKIAQIQKQ